MQYAAKITGIGSAFPEKRLGNDELADMLVRRGFDTNNQWIVDRTGIRERRIANVQDQKDHHF